VSRVWLALPAAAVTFNLVALAHEITSRALPLNDHVLHHGLVRRTVEAWAAGDSVLDHWVGDWVLGFPVFQYYQHLPHLVVAAIQRLTGADLLFLVQLTNVLAVSLFPLAMFAALRWVAVSPRAAALASVAAPLLSTPDLFGFDFGSYLWRGRGLYTQAWGMCVLPFAVAACFRLITTGRGVAIAAALLAVTLLTHVVHGWIAVVSALVLACAVPADVGLARRLGRLVPALAGAGVAASYFLIPYALNHAHLNRSVWEPATKYDSYGLARVLQMLVTGQLFDAGRLPVLTIALVVGVVVAARRRAPVDRALLALLGTWLALYFGRATWGALLDLLPGAGDMHFHRLIAGVHLAAIPLIGIGLAAVVDAAGGLAGRLGWPHASALAGGFVVVISLAPAVVERARYVDDSRRWMAASAAAMAERERDVAAVVALLERLQREAPARVYAGRPNGWGGRFVVGHVPMYAVLSVRGLPTLGYTYHTMSPTADVMNNFDERRRDHYDVFNVGYVVAPAGQSLPAFVELLATHGPFAVYRVPPTGYVALVRSAARVSGSREHLYRANRLWLASPLPSLGDHPLLARDTGAARVGAVTIAVGAGERGRVVNQQLERQGWSATIAANHPSYALVKATYHPWWRAELDGEEVKTVAMAPGFVGVPVTAGEHRLRVQYQPPRWKTILAMLGPLLLVALAVAERRGGGLLARVVRSQKE
jgi:hypothetical protein